MKTSYKQQYEVLKEIQSNGFNVCTCGNCGGFILYNQEMEDADFINCPHCKEDMYYSDNPDFYYDNF